MSEAENLLNSLLTETEGDSSNSLIRTAYILVDSSTGKKYYLYVKDGNLMMADASSSENQTNIPPVMDVDEPHIVIDEDRYISVPQELQRIAVQHDHNVETVTFDCPRYWDGHDLSTMKVYVNYQCPNKAVGAYHCTTVFIDESDPNIMHFYWTISRNVTHTIGKLRFNVCVKYVTDTGDEVEHWNSEINEEMHISEGLEVAKSITEKYSDILSEIRNRMGDVDLKVLWASSDKIQTLRDAIAVEATNRENEDTSLENDINEETAKRAKADALLDSQITELENRTSTNTDGDLTVSGDITITGQLTTNNITWVVYT